MDIECSNNVCDAHINDAQLLPVRVADCRNLLASTSRVPAGAVGTAEEALQQLAGALARHLEPKASRCGGFVVGKGAVMGATRVVAGW